MTQGPLTPRPTAHDPAVVLPLLRAAHLGPTAAVTTIAALLCVASDVPTYRAALVTLKVLTGQLSVGWGNDLIDRDRDRAAGRTDKPLAVGELQPAYVRTLMGAAITACIVLSLGVGWRSGLVHIVLAVAAAHAYDLRLKSTVWFRFPCAVAFGAAPAVVSLAAAPPRLPPVWMVAAAATLGVAAHPLNALLDVEADTATGERGLPYRLGVRLGRAIATMLLVTASIVIVAGPGTSSALPPTVTWTALTGVAVLAAIALVGSRSARLSAAIGIALIDVALIAARAN